MATTTPNYGWPVPTSTDLVKDGATAIEALGDAIDATAAASFGGGLVKISTTNFSAVSSQAVTFASSTYKNYKIIMRWTQTANTTLSFRVRAATTDYTGSEYNNAVFFVRSAGTTTGVMTSSQNQSLSSMIGSSGNDSGVTSINQLDMLVSNIFEATSTSVSTRITVPDASGNTLALMGSHRVRDGVSYDSLNFILGSGTMTGTIQIFGVKE
jgi:hypothetical protein